mgnify:FL=1
MCKLLAQLPDDLITLITQTAFQCTASEFFQDLDFYTTWANTVPAMFISAQVLDLRFWYCVANPMIRWHPFIARRHLKLLPHDIWAGTLPCLVQYLDRERLRSLKTYKRCVVRWVDEAVTSHHVWFYQHVLTKVLIKLRIEHFRPNCPQFFVREALSQIASFAQ